MVIREYIQRYLKSKPKVWGADYRQVPVDKLINEYAAIQQYLLSNCSPGTRVAIGLTRDYRYFLTLLACMNIGVVFIPLRKEWPGARVSQIRKISGFEVMITDRLMDEIISQFAIDICDEFELPMVSSDHPLYCLFTSGTSGEPKGVLIRRSAYENFLRWSDDYFRDIGEGDRLLNSTDYTFDVAMAEVALTLTRQVAFYCSNFRDDFFKLLSELHDLKISVIATVPNNFMLLLDKRLVSRADLSNLRYALIAGARFPLSLKRQFDEFLCSTRVYNCYGPTEATIYCLARELMGPESEFVEQQTVSVGSAIPGCIPLIVDEELRRVEAMQPGELLIGGNQVMDSYLGNPSATSDAFVNIDGVRYYRTGDIAFFDFKGDFFIKGRNDDTIKVSGQRVNLSDIDSYVQQMDFVKSCASIAVEHSIRDFDIVLHITTTRVIAKQDIMLALKEVLPNHQLPKDLVIMDRFPVNNSGKICKKTLKKVYQEDLSEG
jgi:acyl-coenzyme A synthetase/AMP-(fatty) acid ligase